MLKDYETFWMIYILVISALGNLLNQTLPAGILGYRNENNRTEHRLQIIYKIPNIVSFLMQRADESDVRVTCARCSGEI